MPGRLSVALELNAEDLASPQIRRVISQVERLQQASAKLNDPQGRGAGASGMLRLSRDTQQAQQSMSAFSQILQNAFGVAGGIGIADVIAAVVAGLVNVSAAAIRSNASLERMQVTLRAFTRDPKLADAMTTMLRGNADATPFGTAEVMQAGTQLVPIARTTEELEKAVRLAERLATLNPEQGLSGAVFALREAAAGDYISLIERGNVPRSLVNRLKAEGFTGLDLATEAMARMGVEWSLVEEQGKTFEGRLSTMTSALQELGRVAGSPSFDVLSAHIDKWNEGLARNRPGLTTVAGGFGAAAGEVLDWQITALEGGAQGFLGIGANMLYPFQKVPGWARQAWSPFPVAGDLLGRLVGQSGLWMPGQPNPVMDRVAEWVRWLKAIDAQIGGTAGGDAVGAMLGAGEQRRGERSMGFDAAALAASQRNWVRLVGNVQALQRTGERAPGNDAEVYFEALRRGMADQEDMISRHTGRWRDTANAITDATQKVQMYNDRLKGYGAKEGALSSLLDPLYAYRGLARRTGTFTGPNADLVNAAILDLKTRSAAMTREEGLAALQAYLARRYEEQVGGSFFSTEDVSVTATNVYVNGQGTGGQMSTLSGPGAPVSDMISRRYENSRGPWPWLGYGEGVRGVGGGR